MRIFLSPNFVHLTKQMLIVQVYAYLLYDEPKIILVVLLLDELNFSLTGRISPFFLQRNNLLFFIYALKLIIMSWNSQKCFSNFKANITFVCLDARPLL